MVTRLHVGEVHGVLREDGDFGPTTKRGRSWLKANLDLGDGDFYALKGTGDQQTSAILHRAI